MDVVLKIVIIEGYPMVVMFIVKESESREPVNVICLFQLGCFVDIAIEHTMAVPLNRRLCL